MEFTSVLKKFKGKKATILFDQALFSLFNFGSIFALSKLADVTVFSDFVVFQSNIFFYLFFVRFFYHPLFLSYTQKKMEST
jgi:hypothetical protein